MHQRSMILLLAVCLGLSGCASKYGEQTAIVAMYSDCYEPIRVLRAEEHRVAQTTAGAAVAGGLIGALVGGLTGGARGAIAGGISGAAAAGTLGYFTAVQSKNKDENARMARYMQDLDGDISGLNIATASARMAIQCYEQKFEMRLAQYKEKAITREQLEVSYKEIKSGVDEAHRILGKVIVTAQESDAKYQAAINEEAKLQKPEPQPVSQPAPQAATRQVSRPPSKQAPQPEPQQPQPNSFGAVKAKQVGYQTSIADAQKAQKEAEEFNLRMAENMS